MVVYKEIEPSRMICGKHGSCSGVYCQRFRAIMSTTVTEIVAAKPLADNPAAPAKPLADSPATFSSSSKANQGYKYLSTSDVDHFLTKGWLLVPNAIKQDYIDSWMKDLFVRVGYDEDDKSTWHTEYLHLPRHREVPAEEFCPDAWNKIAEIAGGLDRIDPVRERYYGDAFIVNFGSEDKTHLVEDKFRPQERSGWHVDDDWYRCFLDSSGNAMTIIHVFTDIPPRGGGTWLCEDGLKGEPA